MSSQSDCHKTEAWGGYGEAMKTHENAAVMVKWYNYCQKKQQKRLADFLNYPINTLVNFQTARYFYMYVHSGTLLGKQKAETFQLSMNKYTDEQCFE